MGILFVHSLYLNAVNLDLVHVCLYHAFLSFRQTCLMICDFYCKTL